MHTDMKKIYISPAFTFIKPLSDEDLLDGMGLEGGSKGTVHVDSKESGVTYWSDEDPEDWDE